MSVRVGLIGYGLAGRLLHAPLIAAAGLEITAVATSRGDAVAADFPMAAVVGEAEALCARGDVDLVVVVTPDHLHAAHVRLALDAGRHVVVDKPFAPTAREAVALIALAERRGCMLTVFQNRRWDADFLTLRQVLDAGALGEVSFYFGRWDRFRPKLRGDWHDDHMQGELFGLGPHLVDQALTLFGTPDWLWADVFDQRGMGANDGCELLMGKGRLRISLGINMLAADEIRLCRVLGSKGAFEKIGLDPQEAHLRAHKPLDAGFGVDPEENWARITEAGGAEHRIPSVRGDWVAFYRGIRAALETGAPPPVDARAAARTIAVLEAALASSATGQRVELAPFLAERGLG